MIRLENISKEYKEDRQKIRVLDNINLEIKDNEFIAIMGASGSGKTTLLNIIGCMDKARYGTYYLDVTEFEAGADISIQYVMKE